MNVNLISSTKSHSAQGIEQLIVSIARVSSSRENKNEDPEKLIKYLIDHKHWSPFEMVDFTFEIITSRAIAQQILRHRSFSFQEFSLRYAESLGFESIQLRKQAVKNRQSSEEVINPELYGPAYNPEDDGNDVCWIEGEYFPADVAIEKYLEVVEKMYESLLESGVAKECARMILPLCTQTKIYMKGSLRSWIHYFEVRCDQHTQLEHREIALEIRNQMKEYLPTVSKVLKW